VLETHTHQDGEASQADLRTGAPEGTQAEGAEGERRERRSRDRYGRDRRERGGERREEGAQSGLFEENRAASRMDSAPAAIDSIAPQTAAAPASKSSLPRVQAFELPVAQLQQVAEGSGLTWVNSDADKIAAVQAAIAAEPKPVRVPRERPPAVVIDEGPLVLVETRRDLSEMKLPFES
jgi:ribonuclease E